MAPLACITMIYLQNVAQEVHHAVLVLMLLGIDVDWEVVRETCQVVV